MIQGIFLSSGALGALGMRVWRAAGSGLGLRGLNRAEVKERLFLLVGLMQP